MYDYLIVGSNIYCEEKDGINVHKCVLHMRIMNVADVFQI